MVNEKIIIIFGPILLARYLIDKKSENFYLLISIIISVILYPVMIYVTMVLLDYNFFNIMPQTHHTQGYTAF